MTAVLALDQGTSGTKALVVDEAGNVLSCVELPVTPTYGHGGLVEQDPMALLASVIDTGRQAVSQAGVEISAIGLANQGETVLAWDPATGEPLTPMIVWQDSRAQNICDELDDRSKHIAAVTGLANEPYFAAAKMAWLRRSMTTSGVVTTSDSWLLHQLTGEFVTDVSTASRTGLLDLDSRSWSQDMLTLYSLSDEMLPRIATCSEHVGSTALFGSDIPVTGLAVDQQSALFAQGCLAGGQAKCTYGTGAFLLANIGETPARSRHGLTTSVAWDAAGNHSYVVDGQVFTVGSMMRWLTSVGILDGPERIDDLVRGVATSEGVVVVPSLAGLGAPHSDSSARAVISGLSLNTSQAHIVRATLEGIAIQVLDILDAIAADGGAPVEILRVDGGLTRSHELMQIQADLAGRPVEVFASPHATALGVAGLAVLGLKSGDFNDGVLEKRKLARYEPQMSQDQAAEVIANHRHVMSSIYGN